MVPREGKNNAKHPFHKISKSKPHPPSSGPSPISPFPPAAAQPPALVPHHSLASGSRQGSELWWALETGESTGGWWWVGHDLEMGRRWAGAALAAGGQKWLVTGLPPTQCLPGPPVWLLIGHAKFVPASSSSAAGLQEWGRWAPGGAGSQVHLHPLPLSLTKILCTPPGGKNPGYAPDLFSVLSLNVRTIFTNLGNYGIMT